MSTPALPQDLLNKLEALRVRARRRFLGSRKGVHLSPRRGAGLEFADYRSYSPGDDPRTVDWGLYGRTNRPYVKVYQEEEDLFVYVFVDASASMAAPSAEKWAAVSRLALALAYVVLSSEDALRLHRLEEDEPRRTPFLRGRRRLLTARDLLDASPPRGRAPFSHAIAEELRRLRRPGKAIVLSDFLFPTAELQAGLDLLRGAALDTLAIQTLSPEELDPGTSGPLRLVDAEGHGERAALLDRSGLERYRERLERHRRDVRSSCHRSGVQLSFFDTSRDLSSYVLTELPRLGLLRP